jgi:iduronate 2-sulfatase
MKTRVLIAFLSAFTFCKESSVAAEKLNVLLIAVDDLKPIAGCYGGTAKTPNLDKLAARGVRFDRAYCNQAVCAPSRNALMTGLRPQTLGIYDLGTNFRKARPDAVTLSQAFQKAGYRTEAMGKILHVGHGNQEDAASWTVPHFSAKSIAYHLPASRAKEGLTREEALFENKSADKLPRGAAYESADVGDDQYPDAAIADEAIKRLRKAKESGVPSFIAVGFVKPHLPFCAPKKYWDLYDRTKIELPTFRSAPQDAPAFALQYGGELRQYADTPESGPLPDDLARTLIHGYHAATSYMDAQLGRVLDALEKEGLAEKTIVVLWGDHGWHLGDHGMWCKHTNYEQAARIPLIIAAPGVKSGVSAGFIETVDLFPTLCEMASVAAPTGLDGKSFAANLRDVSAPARDHITHVYPRSGRLGRAVRDARYRMVEWKKHGAPAEEAIVELYDYETDPLETANIAAQNPAVLEKMRALLARQPEARPQFSAASNDKPKTDRAALFDRRDKDKDGKLTREEFLTGQPDAEKAPARFLQFDASKDGTLSREEFIQSGKVAK